MKLFIASRCRDTTVYPNPNRFRVYLPSPIYRVSRISLGNAVIPNITLADPYPYVAIVTDLFTRGIAVPAEMQQYPAGTIGFVFNDQPAVSFMMYADEGNAATWQTETAGVIARLQEFEISLMAFGSTTSPPVLYPLTAYAPGKFPEWCCTLKFTSVTADGP